MRAVWSFWSRPFLAQKGWAWRSPLHHLLAWGLSVAAASRHYPDTLLVTDRFGKELLADTLGLPFANVSTELERLSEADPDWWALGKLVAYSLQDRPFVHIDTDAFLWKPLPPEVAVAPVFAQCPEYFPRVQRRSWEIERALGDAHLPVEWRWAVSRDDVFIREENCGIVGGNRVDFLRYYAQTAIDLVLRPEHARAWTGCVKSNTVIEQFLLAACVDFHRFHPDSPYRGVRVRYLFPSWDDASNPANATRAGFTHLLGDAKSHPLVGRRIEARVRRDDQAYFRRCEKAAAHMSDSPVRI